MSLFKVKFIKKFGKVLTKILFIKNHLISLKLETKPFFQKANIQLLLNSKFDGKNIPKCFKFVKILKILIKFNIFLLEKSSLLLFLLKKKLLNLKIFLYTKNFLFLLFIFKNIY